MTCQLCTSKTRFFYRYLEFSYHQCLNCGSIGMEPKDFPTFNEEKTRYETHNNDVNDVRYQAFVAPITSAVIQDFNVDQKGLDFGSGTGPVISSILRKKGYQLTTYDPIFDNNKSALETTYDFIVCCEVMEHFHHPYQEFQRLKNLLKPNGKLYCMTEIYDENINFSKWYYKNDPTHVFFYHRTALEWIQKNIGFRHVSIDKRLVIFEA